MIKNVYYLKRDVRNVTEVYYNIIFSSLRNNNVNIFEIRDLGILTPVKSSKEDYYLVTGMLNFYLLYLKGIRNFIFWFQGVAPEEMYLSTNSKVKMILMEKLEKFALLKCKYKIGVSKYQFLHFEHKYKIKLNPKEIFVMPCFNSVFSSDLFHSDNKYTKDIFCYAGGMQAWQGFDEILQLYSEIEKHKPNSFLKILSKDLEIAREKLNKYNIKNYSLKSVPQDQVSAELAGCKYGFIIREDNIINNVATPTKLAAYVGNGIIPIFTKAIHFYKELSEKYRFLCCIDSTTDIGSVLHFMSHPIDSAELETEYKRLFDDYFSSSKYIDQLSSYFSANK